MRTNYLRRALHATLGCVIAVITGCAARPAPHPDSHTALAWQAAVPSDGVGQAAWWETFADPALVMLLSAARLDNPGIAQAAAAIATARAELGDVAADGWPAMSVSAQAARSGSLDGGADEPRATNSQLDASWEMDIFGRVRNAKDSARALVQAREADYRGVQLSLTAEVALQYVDYRACRLMQAHYEIVARSQATTRELVEHAARAGFMSTAETNLAKATAASARETALAQDSECEIVVKSLVALTGMPEPSVREVLGAQALALPALEPLRVERIPAEVLRQRPDIVAAEHELVSAGSLIGVAEAARWPTLSLVGNVGVSAVQGAPTTQPWSFGPLLVLPLFDGGRIQAQIVKARASYDAALAHYQQTVRDAVREVEQALVRTGAVMRREDLARESLAGYEAYLAAIDRQFHAGTASLMDLETARRDAVAAQVKVLELQQSRLAHSIALYKAVGGDWHEPTHTQL